MSGRYLLDTNIVIAFIGQDETALRQAGTPIPENDIWIAALAHQYALTVASRDEHFAHVKGILLETW